MSDGRSAKLALLAGTIALGLLVPRGARAQLTKSQCVDANTSGQALRLDGKFAAARQQLATCDDPRCPGLVRDDCAARLAELDRAQPTMVFDVEIPGGAGPVSVTVDGHLLTGAVDASPRRVDPGAHVYTFTAPGRATVSQTVSVAEGERARHVHVVLPALPAPSPPPTPPSPPREGSTSTSTIAGAILAGTGVAAIAVGSIFGVLTSAAADRQKRDCAGPTSCVDRARALDDHSAALTDSAISTVAFVSGAALLAGGAVLFFTGLRRAEPAARVSIAPAVTASGAAFSLRGEF